MLLRYGRPAASTVLELVECAGPDTERILAAVLDAAVVGWRFHIIGTNAEVAVVRSRLLRGGAVSAEITTCSTDEPGPVHVFCGHCHSVTDAGAGPMTVCSGCARDLRVSTHFSHRHASYLGVGES